MWNKYTIERLYFIQKVNCYLLYANIQSFVWYDGLFLALHLHRSDGVETFKNYQEAC